MLVDIAVTQEDIDNGIRGSGSMCPVALAVRRRTGDINVSVYSRGVLFFNRSSSLVAQLPSTARAFISAFDSGALPKALLCPFTFQMDIPDPFMCH